jgi:transposase InsO family protein
MCRCVGWFAVGMNNPSKLKGTVAWLWICINKKAKWSMRKRLTGSWESFISNRHISSIPITFGYSNTDGRKIKPDALRHHINQAGWVTDITYHIWQQKRDFLSTILDLQIRFIFAFVISPHNNMSLVLDNFYQVLNKRKNRTESSSIHINVFVTLPISISRCMRPLILITLN